MCFRVSSFYNLSDGGRLAQPLNAEKKKNARKSDQKYKMIRTARLYSRASKARHGIAELFLPAVLVLYCNTLSIYRWHTTTIRSRAFHSYLAKLKQSVYMTESRLLFINGLGKMKYIFYV